MRTTDRADQAAAPPDVGMAVHYGGLCLKILTALPADPLEALTPGDRRRLADQARASLRALVPAATRRLLDRGRCAQLVDRRMRWMLAQATTAQAGPGKGER